MISASPAAVAVAGGPALAVTGWAGPWPVEERWWDAGGHRKARLQVVLEDGAAHLLTRERGAWRVEATYE
jgi:protein ImuB